MTKKVLIGSCLARPLETQASDSTGFRSFKQIIVELKNNSMNNIDSNTGEIVMYQPDETIRLEVRVENETVWLTQQQIADLFQSSRTNVVEHVMHIYEDEELEESSTCRKFRQVRKEGKRMVSRVVPMYNLDMIISVGYRINSKRGVKFRQWANFFS